MTTSHRPEWLAPAGLIVLTLVPAIAGSTRLGQLASGALTDDNARFFAEPVPVIVHIIAATLFCGLGALQFAPRLRRGRWHRRAGRVLAPAGLLAALSGLWMTVTYPDPLGPDPLLVGIRIVVGTAMVVFIVLALRAIQRREFTRHGAWMTRAYALGIGAGTQVLTTIPWVLVAGPPDRLTRTLLLAAGWAINVLVAEWVIRRRVRPRPVEGLVVRSSRTDALL